MTNADPPEPEIELSVVMPCLNEVKTLGTCVEKAQRCIESMGIAGEVLVADNGSTDGSVELAEKLGARVVRQPRKGYGAALKAGVAAARGRFVIMGDCDDSYDFTALAPFVERLREGNDLVMGNRFKGGIRPGAMPPLHRYFGNPLLTFLGRKFFKIREFGDFYCGLRGFRREAIRRLRLHSMGMEYALEMVIKATMNGYRLAEVPTTLDPDGRDRKPHLRSFRDGWRSLRFYLLMAPRWMFGVPGLLLFGIGGLLMLRLLPGSWNVGGITLSQHTLLYACAAIVLGYQMMLFGVFAKLLAVESGLHPPVTKLERFRGRSVMQDFLGLGSVLGLGGLLLAGAATRFWVLGGFGDIDADAMIRLVILSVLLLILGGQTIIAGCHFGLYNLVAERGAEREIEERFGTG